MPICWFKLDFSVVRMAKEKVPPKGFVKEKIIVSTKTRRGKVKFILRDPKTSSPSPQSSPRKGLLPSPTKRQRVEDDGDDNPGRGASQGPELPRTTKVHTVVIMFIL